MRRLGLALALCSSLSTAYAQVGLPFPGPGMPTAAVAYSGPGDVVSFTGWWGLRAYNAAYATGSNNAIKIRRASDSTTSNIVILASGALDVATATTFCASTTCFVAEAYDQTGGGAHMLQATAGNQPQLIFNCIGSLPCMSFNGSSQFLLATLATVAFPVSVSIVVDRTGAFTTQQAAFNFHTGAGTGQFFFLASANSLSLYNGSALTNATVADSAFHAANGVYNSTTSSLYVDNQSATNGATGAGAVGTVVSIGALTGGSSVLTGEITEAGLSNNVAWTSTNAGNLCHNQTYWGAFGC